MFSQLDEIRINNTYASSMIADYENGDPKKESKPIINKRTMRTEELLDKLNKLTDLKPKEFVINHLFPPNCRYFEQYSEGFLVVIEEPPAYRTISSDSDYVNELQSLKSSGKLEEYGYKNWLKENTKPYKFNLALPYVVFFLSFNSSFELLGGKMFFRTQPISGFSDILCKAPFLNINDSQTICFGDKIHRGPHRSIFADVNYVVSTFWSTIFNNDYMYNYIAYQDTPILGNYFSWEYHSHTDPMFIYKADWIKAKDMTVQSTVNELRNWILHRHRSESSSKIGYSSLKSIFNSHSKKDMEKIPRIDASDMLIYDVAQYIYLDDVVYLRVGDSFKDKNGKKLFVDSFLGFRNMSDPVYVNIQHENGKIFRMMLNSNTKKFLLDKIKEERYVTQTTLPNGTVIKYGDIISMKDTYDRLVYSKIHYLRHATNGHLEARIGSEYYFIDSLPTDTAVLDMSNPDYFGNKLEMGKEYFVLRRDRNHQNPNLPISTAIFNEITTNQYKGLILLLTDTDKYNKGNTYKVDLNNSGNMKRIFQKEELKELPPVFRLGKKLVYLQDQNKRNGEGDLETAYSSYEFGVGFMPQMAIRKASKNITNGLLIKDDTFTLKSWDYDIEFSIGDKVVVANWENPVDMLTIKQINGFVENKDSGDITFVMADKNGKMYEHVYIDGKNSSVKIGSVRKITNKYGDLSAGMKIVAKESGISMFPKKDNNIIIGFIIDTGVEEPFILCSNACTLWYSDVINKFDKIKMGTKAWKAKDHAPINPSKIRIQAGDSFNGQSTYKNNYGFVAHIPIDSRSIRAQHLDYYDSYLEAYVFDKRFVSDIKFDSILNPRLTTKQENDLGFVHAFPTFHGSYIETKNTFSSALYPNDRRSIINVPNSGE